MLKKNYLAEGVKTKMSNSPLVNYTRISPNSNNPRKDKIRKITIHHMAGNLSVETCGNIFAASSRGASSNYGIGSDGRVGMYVEEKNRSWCSSSPSNDHQAITIEVANDGGAPNWHVSDTALNKLIELCVDICKRNGIAQLNYTGDSSGNLTRHNMFKATTCPGPYLQSKFPYIASEVNKRLNGTVDPTPDPTPSDKFNIGDEVIVNGPLYVSSNASGSTGYVKNKRTRITRKAPGTAHPYNTTGDLGWMNESSIQAVNVPKPGPSGKFNIGDKVVINGPLYVSSNASSPSGQVSNKITNITRKAAGSAHPYNTTGDLGWMDESSITKYNEPVDTSLKIGDTVKIVGTGNGSSYGNSGTAYGIGWTRQILGIYPGRPYPYRVGNASGTIGFYAENALQKI